jgi:hypothetical protein
VGNRSELGVNGLSWIMANRKWRKKSGK